MFKLDVVIKGYITVSEIAKKWNVNPRTIQVMCLKGKIQGAEKIGNMWMIYIRLTKCCNKLKVYMMNCGLTQTKVTSYIINFKKRMKVCME